MSDSESNQIKELTKALNELNLSFVRLQSHMESELGNNTRQLSDVSDKLKSINHKMFGNGSNDIGVLMRVDRLEQSAERRRKVDYVVLVSAMGLVFKIVYDLIKIL